MRAVRSLFTSSFRNAIKLVFIIILTIFIILFLEALLQNDDSVSNRKKALLALEKNSIDIMFVGNSHAYCTYNPAIIKAKVDKRIINAGLPDQKIDITYYTLKELLNRQNPQVIVLEAFVFGRTRDDYSGYLANMDSLNLSLDKIRACFEIYPDKLEALRMCTRLYRCHNNWRKLPVIEENLHYMFGSDKLKYTKFGDGFYRLESGMSEEVINQYKKSTTSKFTADVDDYSIGYFKRIVKLCNKKGIKLVLTMSPMNDIYLEKIDYRRINEKISQVCTAQGIDFIDFNTLYHQIGLTYNDFENSFNNAQHTNIHGAEKVSKYFADYLSDYLEAKDLK